MKTALRLIIVLLLVSANSFGQERPLLSNTELLAAVGSWQGNLSYLDYSSQKQTVIPATIDIEQIRPGVFTFSHQFPKEPQVKWTDTVAISKDGSYFGKEKLVAKKLLPDGGLEWVTEENGRDDDKPALLRRFYTATPDRYSIRKEVRYEGFSEWLVRHEYRYETRARYQCGEIAPRPNRFKGKIYLVTDVSNSSATFIMADVFKTNKLGTIVGEMTGGTQQGINGGELFFFYLPQTRIEMDLPLIYQAPRTQRPDEGVKPHYEVKTTALDIATGRDAQIEFIMKRLIKN